MMSTALAEIQHYSTKSIAPLLVISGRKPSMLSLTQALQLSPSDVAYVTLG